MLLQMTPKRLEALRKARREGFATKSSGLVKQLLAVPRTFWDEVRRREVASDDYRLTGWGQCVATYYQPSVERLPVGTYINHRIHSYTRTSVRLADDGNEVCTVSLKRPLRILANRGGGLWEIPIDKGGITYGSPEEGWYLRNLLNLDIELVVAKSSTGPEEADAFTGRL